MTPKRIQRKRTKGWRLPEGTVCVTRPGKYGNPFVIGSWFRRMSDDWQVWTWGDTQHFGNVRVDTLSQSIAYFRSYATARAKWDPEWLESLRGKDLACWCPSWVPCHADVLLEIANVDSLEVADKTA